MRLLEIHKIEQIVDVRTIPKSGHNPQFAEVTLQKSLEKKGIAYSRLASLGGFRSVQKDSKNLGWRNLSFRGYADYLSTPEFAEGLSELETLAKRRRTAFMCAEAVPWRCHRSLIADALTVGGWEVFDILNENAPKPHRLTPFLIVVRGKLTYPGPTPPLDL